MIELPIAACSVNKFYRSVGHRVIISKDGREFKKKIDLLLNNYSKITGEVKLTLHFYFRDNRKHRDIDNYCKVIIDCLKNKLFDDDDEIMELNVKKFIGCGFDRIDIDVVALTDEEKNYLKELKIGGDNIKKQKAKEKKELDKLKKLKEKNDSEKIDINEKKNDNNILNKPKIKKTKSVKIEHQFNL